MKRLSTILLSMLLLTGCVAGNSTVQSSEGRYIQITQQEAKSLMDSDLSVVILDVRTMEEYQQGHIPNAILLPDYEVSERAQEVIPDKDSIVLVYCRSGRRSLGAAQTLAEMGYTDVREFGGIITWEYEITT